MAAFSLLSVPVRQKLPKTLHCAVLAGAWLRVLVDVILQGDVWYLQLSIFAVLSVPG